LALGLLGGFFAFAGNGVVRVGEKRLLVNQGEPSFFLTNY
jgi:hypothetical protein